MRVTFLLSYSLNIETTKNYVGVNKCASEMSQFKHAIINTFIKYEYIGLIWPMYSYLINV